MTALPRTHTTTIPARPALRATGLRARRTSLGLSMQTLADRAGLSKKHIKFLEWNRSYAGPHAIRKLLPILALPGETPIKTFHALFETTMLQQTT